MNVVLFAWCPTARYYFDALCDEGVSPVRVVTGCAAPAGASLAEACSQRGVPLDRQDDANEPTFVERLGALAPDLVLVAGWPRVLGRRLLERPRLGTLNLHPSLLPEYRGRHPLFWAIVHGEAKVGITVHHVTEAMDQGPILLQRSVDVPADATSESLARDVDARGAELVPDILAMARSGRLPAGTLPAEPGSHFPPARATDGVIRWTWPAEDVERRIRACRGTLRASAFLRGTRVVPWRARLATETSVQAPGTVQSLDAEGVTIAAAPGSPAVRIERWLFLDREFDAPSLADALSLTVGSRFTDEP